jgi:Collagen triple helix repeat (20 copies)
MKTTLVAAIVAAVVAAASGTAATIVVTSKNIKNGTIQTVDISAKAKRALKGNRGPRGLRGLAGAQGAQGIQGLQGPPGAAGAPGAKGDKGDGTDAYATEFCSTEAFPSLCTGTPIEVSATTAAEAGYFLTLADLPAGFYTLSATVVLRASATADAVVACHLRSPVEPPPPPAFVTTASAAVGDDAGHVLEATIPLSGAVQLLGTFAAGIKCFRPTGSPTTNPVITYAFLRATKVTSLRCSPGVC